MNELFSLADLGVRGGGPWSSLGSYPVGQGKLGEIWGGVHILRAPGPPPIHPSTQTTGPNMPSEVAQGAISQALDFQ